MAQSVFEMLSSASFEPVSEAGVMERTMSNLHSGNSADTTGAQGPNGERDNVGIDEVKVPDGSSLMGLLHQPLVAQHVESIRQLHRRSVANIIEIGRRLSECKQLLGHGHWQPWLQREFKWSERTARNYILLYEYFGKTESVADLAIDLSSLYLIAAGSTPPEARTEVISRIGSGEALSRSEIQRVVQQAKRQRSIAPRVTPSVSVEEVLDRTGFAAWRSLSPIEREMAFELAKREGQEIGLEWAGERAKLKKKHRDLMIVLDLADACAKTPVRKVVAAVPDEHRHRTAERLKTAIAFLSDLSSKLTEK